jgi:hypothetical protein
MFQVELIGCTSSGKTTLASSIADAARAEGMELILGDDVVMRRLGTHRVSSPQGRAAVVHIVTLMEVMKHRGKHRDFLSAARRSLHAVALPRVIRWHQFRKVLKQLGRYELIQRTAQECPLVLVDEGTVQSAHNLFVHVGYACDEAHLRQFAECVPLPDLVVYVGLSENDLIERTLRRGHRRISCPTRATVQRFVSEALRTFDNITRHPRIADRTMVIRDGVIVRKPTACELPAMKTTIDVISRALQKQLVASHCRRSSPVDRSAATT